MKKHSVTSSARGRPIFPASIGRLPELAHNLWWAWNSSARRLFADLDRDLWEDVNHNPVRLLAVIPQTKLDQVANNDSYLRDYTQALGDFDEYIVARYTWFRREFPDWENAVIAYFSPEFGLHESLPFYAGGLGVLSGDHSKAASDLGIPLVGVGCFYRQGYFRQSLSADGSQDESWECLDHTNQPIVPVRGNDDLPLRVVVELPGRSLYLRVWRLQVGRVPIFLMDADTPENSLSDCQLTARLYTVDRDVRIAQELVLGVGGVRALRAMGISPSVWHMNEGHSAFMILERIAQRVEAGSDFESAVDAVRASTVFTTHTPVAAGNEMFEESLVDAYLSPYQERMGITKEDFMALAEVPGVNGRMFSLSKLALRFSGLRNGVSVLHAGVSQRMWSNLWPQKASAEVPIQHVTNGVHVESWLSPRIGLLFCRYLGEDWREHIDDRETWQRVHSIPDDELWDVHSYLKLKLIRFLRARDFAWGGELMDADSLTIGFARRFTAYKRAGLVLHDMERFLALLNNPDRRLQFVFAGKAHPADESGKRLIEQVCRVSTSAECDGRVAFVQDYDQNVARHLLQGVDVWLNTPRRPQEASGTSGQKAALNGVLNLSIKDGWWPEGFNGSNGWEIGGDSIAADDDVQDVRDAESLYALLESEVLPRYYSRDEHNLPREWLVMMKSSISSVTPGFSACRMVKEYCMRMYTPAMGYARLVRFD